MNLDWNSPVLWSILLIDDEPDNVEVVFETLEFNGVIVRFAPNGQLGLDILRDFTPDLVLLDLSMPVMDGWQTLRRIKDNPIWSGIPVLAISAHAIHGDKERALAAGFDGYLVKPVNVRTLVDDLRNALVHGCSN